MKKKALIIILILFMFVSVANNYFASNYITIYKNYYLKQLLFYLFGFLLIMILKKININFIIKNSLYLYLFGVLLLFLVLIFGITINGAKSWFYFKGLSFQPSEFMKIFLILYLYYINTFKKISNIKYIVISFLIVLIPSILTFLEPDTGAVIFYLIIYFVFLFSRKLEKKYYILILGSFTLLAGVFISLYIFNKNILISILGTDMFYRFDRIKNFLNYEGYQINTALTSISNSQLFGIKDIVYFPEGPTDFAFTLFLANFGIFGLIFLLLLYYLFFKYLYNISNNKFLIYPVFYLILFQYTINILMNIGFFPIIGITLPFISYGGSSLISYMILIGILLNKKVPTLDTY